MRVLLLISVIFIALLISLGGCTSTQDSWMFYQAYEVGKDSSPAPFFLTMEEAQEYCNRMNKSTENNYQVSFIAR